MNNFSKWTVADGVPRKVESGDLGNSGHHFITLSTGHTGTVLFTGE